MERLWKLEKSLLCRELCFLSSYEERLSDDLTNQFHHIEELINILVKGITNGLRLKVSINVIQWLTFKRFAFQGKMKFVFNQQCNCIEMIKTLPFHN